MNFTREQYMMGRDSQYPTTEEMEASAAILLHRVSKLLREYQIINKKQVNWKISSGYRPGHYNKPYSTTSPHLECKAIDIADTLDIGLDKWIDSDPTILERFNLWREHPSKTPSWVHLDIRPRATRTFMP